MTRRVRALPPADVFTVAEARRYGWTASALKHAVRCGLLVHVRRGAYAWPAAQAGPTTAVALTHPALPLSHRCAALVHGLPLLGAPPDRLEVTVAPKANANISGARVHRATLRERDLVTVGERVVTSPARTAVDLARHHPAALAVAALDAVLHRGLADPDELADVLSFCRAWPGAARARRAVALADRHAESPLESLSRLAIIRLGLPVPRPQVEILDRSDRLVGRGDFYWDEFGVVGEADGRSKYSERPVLTAEKDRQEALEDLGLVVVRWDWGLVTRRPDEFRRKLERGFERGRRRDASGFPRLWTL